MSRLDIHSCRLTIRDRPSRFRPVFRSQRLLFATLNIVESGIRRPKISPTFNTRSLFTFCRSSADIQFFRDLISAISTFSYRRAWYGYSNRQGTRAQACKTCLQRCGSGTGIFRYCRRRCNDSPQSLSRRRARLYQDCHR
jgi:hypothetical protein